MTRFQRRLSDQIDRLFHWWRGALAFGVILMCLIWWWRDHTGLELQDLHVINGLDATVRVRFDATTFEVPSNSKHTLRVQPTPHHLVIERAVDATATQWAPLETSDIVVARDMAANIFNVAGSAHLMKQAIRGQCATETGVEEEPIPLDGSHFVVVADAVYVFGESTHRDAEECGRAWSVYLADDSDDASNDDDDEE